MKYLAAVIGFVLRFFGWLFISTITAITLYLAISMSLLSFKLKITHFVSFIATALLIMAFLFSWWKAHRSFWKKASGLVQKPTAAGLYISSIVLCVGALVLIGIFFSSQFMTRGMGMVSWHEPKMGFFQPSGYGGPAIPKTARNIHIEQTGWLDPYLFLRFEDQKGHLEKFALSAKITLESGVRLPGKDTMFESVLSNATNTPRLAPFAEVKSIKLGRSFLDESRRRCLVIDDEKQVLYYFVW